jgi:hypothetical protein
MHRSLFKFTLALNSTLLIWKLVVFEFLLGISKTPSTSKLNVYSSNKNCPSARCASTANVVCRDVDVFGTKTVYLNHVL